MTSKVSNYQSRYESLILRSQEDFLDGKDRIVEIVFLTNTIFNDPRARQLGLPITQVFEIQPKAIFTTKSSTGDLDFGILELSTKAAGLVDIGILHAHAKIVDAKYAVLICEKSFSKELSYLLTDPKIGPRLLNYGVGKTIKFLDSR